jgi:superfamily II DNA/RNA helicase
MIGIAPTGSGKSVAFLVPMITYLNKLPALDDQTCQGLLNNLFKMVLMD